MTEAIYLDDATVRRTEATVERVDGDRVVLDRTVFYPAGVDPVRIVEIEGVDRTACGGTHVPSTEEIGRVRVTGRETRGSGEERLRFELE
ncbi:hypothetical protein BRD17_03420 [Halobacteriales archaeon SW_7_68_16]|nr:MAG: hypothetical protein BRD17_03420 [Halobacteriales archaeon SW_7_68_16]